ncbi:equisetin synthetase [Penicillium lividum]|nr:equisetin synthetase [Penicillium lividum]
MYSKASTDMVMGSFVKVRRTFAEGVDLEASVLPAYAPEDIETGPQIELEWPITISHRIDQMIERFAFKPALKDGLGNNLTYKQMRD